MTQAQIVNGVVHWLATDVQAAAYPAGALQFVAVPQGETVLEGYLYNAQTGVFTAPPAPPAPPAPGPIALTPLQFLVYLQSQGLTNAQIAALKASTDPNMSTFMLALTFAGQEIVPTGKILTAGLALLVAESVITAQQQAAIIANWPTSPPAV